jgi:hypothetical protein
MGGYGEEAPTIVWDPVTGKSTYTYSGRYLEPDTELYIILIRPEKRNQDAGESNKHDDKEAGCCNLVFEKALDTILHKG